MFYICTIVMPFTVLQCVNKDIIYIYSIVKYYICGKMLQFVNNMPLCLS